MAKIYSFEKLEAWKLAKELAVLIYKITLEFPNEEKFGLVSQIRRCATSIPSNLAEGSGRITGKDKAHYTSVAYASLMELLNQVIISYELEYIQPDIYEEIRNRISKISYLLSQLRQAQLKQ